MSTNNPSISDRELAELIKVLAGLPEDKFAAVMTTLEKLRRNPGVTALIDELRPRITVTRPPRPATLQRFVYLGIEELLRQETTENFEGLISRKAMARAWALLERNNDPCVLEAWQKQIDALGTLRGATREHLQDEIWGWAREEIRAITAAARTDKKVRRELTGETPHLLAEIELAVLMFDVAPHLRRLRRILRPGTIDMLTLEERAGVRHVLIDVKPEVVEHLYGILTFVLGRFTVPGQFLKELPSILSGFPERTKSLLRAQLSALVMGNLDTHTLEVTKHAGELVQDRLSVSQKLIAALKASEQTMPASDKDGQRQLAIARDAASAQLIDIAYQASDAIAATIVPGQIADQSMFGRCEEAVMAIQDCRRMAKAIGMGAKIEEIRLKVVERLEAAIRSVTEQSALATASVGAFKGLGEESVWLLRLLEVSGNRDRAAAFRRSVGIGAAQMVGVPLVKPASGLAALTEMRPQDNT